MSQQPPNDQPQWEQQPPPFKQSLYNQPTQTPPTPTPTPNPIPTNLSITTITLKNGQVLPNEQPLPIPISGVPLTITGSYTSQGSGQVWVLVEDIYGNYYLQHPSVRFGDNQQWTAYNVVTAKGTNRIDFVYVTSQGDKLFQQMVDTNNYGGFTLLPDGSKIILAISIQVTSR